ncbi:MAG: phosphoglycolate phosphatase [Rhodoferax sp.]|nr:MAG: phosphoglycolate phosphatase [Rhodoferax sp.]
MSRWDTQSIQAVLFDLDGTLIDSAPDLGAAADAMRTARGMPSLPLDLYRPMAGAGARGMLGVAFGLTPEAPEFATLREEFFCNYEARMTRSTIVFDGVVHLVAGLQQRGLRWGIVTNKSKRFTNPLVASIADFASAEVVVSGDTTPHSKPHPEPLLFAARSLGVLPEQCLYVGDDERDIQAGKAAGMATVAATYGYLGSQTDTSRWAADAEINSPEQLLQFFVSA